MPSASARKDQKAPLPELFWINKDATSASLSHSSRNAGREINSFVQRRQVAKGRLPNRRKAAKVNKEESSAEAQDDAAAASESAETPPSLTESQDTISTSSDVSSPPPPTERTYPEESEDEKSPLVRSICKAGAGVDPFNCTVIPINERIKSLLNVYISVTEPATWHVELNGQNVEDHRLRSASYQIVRDCMTSELHMYSLMATMASRVEHLEKIPLGRYGTSTFAYKALVALRKYLETRPGVVEHRVIHDMHFLCLAEAYRFNEAGYMVHLRAVKYVVDLVGGLKSVDQHMKETLILGDVYLGAERLSAPIFPLDWDPGKLAPKKREKVVVDTALMQLGRGILCLPDDSVVTSELREIVNDMIQCVQVAQYMWTHAKLQVEYGHWVFLRNLAIIHRLASLKFDLDRDFWRAEVLRIGLIQWVMLCMTKLGPRRCIKVIAPHLKKALEKCRLKQESWSSHAGILTWILIVGATTSFGLPEEKFFISQLAAVTSIIRVRNEQQLHEFSQRYLYLEHRQRKSLAILAKKLLEF